MNDSSPDNGINVRSDGYLIARVAAICPRCRDETRVVALVLPPGHETRSMNDEGDETAAEDSALCRDSWERAACHAFLFYIESLPDAVRQRMQALAPMYRLAPAAQGSYWANHCERCGGIQEDHDLFCEPEGAFLPISPAAASIIEFLPINEFLEAAAAGYALDPEFIEFRAGA
jgi:hypothetical protein